MFSWAQFLARTHQKKNEKTKERGYGAVSFSLGCVLRAHDRALCVAPIATFVGRVSLGCVCVCSSHGLLRPCALLPLHFPLSLARPPPPCAFVLVGERTYVLPLKLQKKI